MDLEPVLDGANDWAWVPGPRGRALLTSCFRELDRARVGHLLADALMDNTVMRHAYGRAATRARVLVIDVGTEMVGDLALRHLVHRLDGCAAVAVWSDGTDSVTWPHGSVTADVDVFAVLRAAEETVIGSERPHLCLRLFAMSDAATLADLGALVAPMLRLADRRGLPVFAYDFACTPDVRGVFDGLGFAERWRHVFDESSHAVVSLLERLPQG